MSRIIKLSSFVSLDEDCNSIYLLVPMNHLDSVVIKNKAFLNKTVKMYYDNKTFDIDFISNAITVEFSYDDNFYYISVFNGASIQSHKHTKTPFDEKHRGLLLYVENLN